MKRLPIVILPVGLLFLVATVIVVMARNGVRNDDSAKPTGRNKSQIKPDKEKIRAFSPRTEPSPPRDHVERIPSGVSIGGRPVYPRGSAESRAECVAIGVIQPETLERIVPLLDLVKNDLSDPKREQYLEELAPFAWSGVFSLQDGAYIAEEVLKYLVGRKEYNVNYANIAALAYSATGNYEDAIRILSEAVNAIESGEYQLGTYNMIPLDSDRERAAVVKDLENRIATLESEQFLDLP